MTDSEKYLFDLWGYVVVKAALSPEQVAALNALVDAKLAESVPADKPNHRFGSLLDWGPAMRDLIDNPRVRLHLETIFGRAFRLDHDYLDVIRPRAVLGPIGAVLHGGGDPFDLGQFYHCQNGRMGNGLSVVAYALKDIHPGDGGFACVPGSHKANFRLPDEWRDMATQFGPCVTAVPCAAGDAVIFTEALTHGTAPWRGADERRTIFMKYSPHYEAWASPPYDPGKYDDITLEARRLLEGPNYRYRGRKGAVD